MPGATFTATSIVDAEPRSTSTRFVAPGLDPTWSWYDVAPVLPVHASVTVDPLTVPARFVGGEGGAHPGPTSSSTSFDASPTPAEFDARTRTK